MEPKPLGKEALIPEGMLREIEYLYGPPNPNSAVVQLVRGYRELLADAMFWREAVKQVSEPFITDRYGAPDRCDYCDRCYHPDPKWTGATYKDPACHTETCPWLLAQD